MAVMLGWFVRRVADPNALIAFYRDVVGLPLIGDPEPNAQRFWAGETFTFAVREGGAPPPAVEDRRQSPINPIFRVTNLAAIRERLERAGVPFFGERQLISGHLIYFLDPSGHVTGLQERYRTSPRAADAEAFRRIDAGGGLPGIAPMPPDLYGLGWISRWVVDPDLVLPFYRDQLGLPFANALNSGRGAMLSLGETALLEVKDGGAPVTPADQLAASNTLILRVPSIDTLLSRLGATPVAETLPPGGRIVYLHDPEGLLIGLQERDAASTRAEDVAARRALAG